MRTCHVPYVYELFCVRMLSCEISTVYIQCAMICAYGIGIELWNGISVGEQSTLVSHYLASRPAACRHHNFIIDYFRLLGQTRNTDNI